LIFTDGSKGSGGFDNATQLVNWLQNNDVGPAGHKSRGQGVKFESLSPSDQATADAATTEDDSNGDNGDSNGDNGDSNGNGSSDDTEETEDDNLMLYGGIGIAVLAVILLMK